MRHKTARLFSTCQCRTMMTSPSPEEHSTFDHRHTTRYTRLPEIHATYAYNTRCQNDILQYPFQPHARGDKARRQVSQAQCQSTGPFECPQLAGRKGHAGFSPPTTQPRLRLGWSLESLGSSVEPRLEAPPIYRTSIMLRLFRSVSSLSCFRLPPRQGSPESWRAGRKLRLGRVPVRFVLGSR